MLTEQTYYFCRSPDRTPILALGCTLNESHVTQSILFVVVVASVRTCPSQLCRAIGWGLTKYMMTACGLVLMLKHKQPDFAGHEGLWSLSMLG